MTTYTNIALDVDGILTDFDAHWRKCAEEVLGCPVVQHNEQHSMGLRYGLSKKDVDTVWDAFHQSKWASVPLYDHASELVLALEDMGCTVWAATSIDERHSAARAESLAGLIPAGRIVCVGHNAHASAKAAMLRGLRSVAFLDDHPANTNAAIGSVPLSVLLDRGYHGLEAPEYGVTVIDDPMDFPVLVEQLLRRTGRAA